MKVVRISLIMLHGLVGTGAVAGGLSAILNPISPLGITTEALKNTPFSDFLIPGIFLFVILGLGNLLSKLASVVRLPLYPYISGFFGATLISWIIIQCFMLKSIVFLHILFFSIGVVIGLLALFLIYTQVMFPFNRISRISKSSK